MEVDRPLRTFTLDPDEVLEALEAFVRRTEAGVLLEPRSITIIGNFWSRDPMRVGIKVQESEPVAFTRDDPSVPICRASKSIGGGWAGYPDLACQLHGGHEGPHLDQDGITSFQSEGEAFPPSECRPDDVECGALSYPTSPDGREHGGPFGPLCCRRATGHEGPHRERGVEWVEASCGEVRTIAGVGQLVCIDAFGHPGAHHTHGGTIFAHGDGEFAVVHSPSPPIATRSIPSPRGPAGCADQRCSLPTGHVGEHSNGVIGWPDEEPVLINADEAPRTCSCSITVREGEAFQRYCCAQDAGHIGHHTDGVVEWGEGWRRVRPLTWGVARCGATRLGMSSSCQLLEGHEGPHDDGFRGSFDGRAT